MIENETIKILKEIIKIIDDYLKTLDNNSCDEVDSESFLNCNKALFIINNNGEKYYEVTIEKFNDGINKLGKLVKNI